MRRMIGAGSRRGVGKERYEDRGLPFLERAEVRSLVRGFFGGVRKNKKKWDGAQFLIDKRPDLRVSTGVK